MVEVLKQIKTDLKNKPNSLMPQILKSLTKIAEILREFHEIFSWPLTICVTGNIIISTLCIFNFTQMLQTEYSFIYHFSVILIASSYIIYLKFYIAYFGEDLSHEKNEIARLFYKISRDCDKETKHLIFGFLSNTILLDDFDMKIFQIFSLNQKFIISVRTIILTYFVVLIQFELAIIPIDSEQSIVFVMIITSIYPQIIATAFILLIKCIEEFFVLCLHEIYEDVLKILTLNPEDKSLEETIIKYDEIEKLLKQFHASFNYQLTFYVFESAIFFSWAVS
ncbi:hypothetical protein PVAND_013227 [Polypedilum vanderplanki]|uniref:Uncharacterized protein n=1 Tax=Polypedilum vanderplanki TaxID=319348 RepID=A0A9J6CQ09_POLVA|nr:hypothetical protein PVAND_013227 [Polypedilum vanderplanki]